MMKPYTLLIVDDDVQFAEFVKRDILTSYPNIFVIDIMNDEEIKKCLDTVNYDVYLLDIEMPAIEGFEVAKQLYNRNKDLLFIFLTTHEELSLVGYEYRAFRFLIKNKYKEFLKRTFDALIEELRKKHTYITVKNEAFVPVDILVSDILYAYIEKNYLVLKTMKGLFQIRTTLSDFENTYKGFPFVCPSKGMLVNITFIERVDYKNSTIYLRGGQGNIKISRRKKEDFFARIARG